MSKKDNLSELAHVIYNAEDLIDGQYNSKATEFSDLVEINERYEKLLVDMNVLVEMINKEL